MIAVWPSRLGFGEQMAEAVLATALAVPVIFTFAVLRGSRLVGDAVAPQLTDAPSDSNETPVAERPSPPVRVVLSGDALGQTTVWDSRLALLMEAVKLAARDASESSINSEAEPETSGADESPKASADTVSPRRRAGGSTRPSSGRVSETPGEAER